MAAGPRRRYIPAPMRSLTARLLVLGCVLLAAAVPATAGAQSNPFTPLPQAQTDTSTQATTSSSTTTADNGGLSRFQEVMIFLAGVALLGGIGFAIVGDARKNAPVTEKDRAGAHVGHAAGATKAQSKAKARAKAKRQRQARKKNR